MSSSSSCPLLRTQPRSAGVFFLFFPSSCRRGAFLVLECIAEYDADQKGFDYYCRPIRSNLLKTHLLAARCRCRRHYTHHHACVRLRSARWQGAGAADGYLGGAVPASLR